MLLLDRAPMCKVGRNVACFAVLVNDEMRPDALEEEVPMQTVCLTQEEIAILDRQDASTGQDGGWQALLVKLQHGVDRATGCIDLGAQELEQIPRYAFDYGNGGWEDRLRGIFERSLGAGLGRG